MTTEQHSAAADPWAKPAPIEAKQALSKDDRTTALGMRIAPWWPEYI